MTPSKPERTAGGIHGAHGTTGFIQPKWWTPEHLTGWERVKEAFKRDWEQTKSDLSFRKAGTDLNQDVPDTVKQAAGKKPIPPASVPNRDADEFTTYEPAFRYGFGARRYYSGYSKWDDKLEGELKSEWSELKTGRSWDESRDYIRRGYDYPV